MFVCDRNVPFAVRFNAFTSVATKERREFRLLSLPLHLVGHLPRLLDELPQCAFHSFLINAELTLN
jgi:hypothetical protein